MIDFTRSVTPCGILVVQLGGKLDLMACKYFFECMQDEIDNGHHKIIVNCKDLGFLSSAGIGMLVRVRSSVKKKGGFITLTELQGHVADLLHFLHMDKIFQIYPTVEIALEAIEKHPAEIA